MSTSNSPTESLEKLFAADHEREFAIAVGRAAWAIMAVLRYIGSTRSNRVVALPSFLCQSPLAAVLEAGWQPLFCDIDPIDGNVPFSEWKRAIDEGASAILAVHLFGNPMKMAELAQYCRTRDVFLLEDAAQALGVCVDGKTCGSWGDASLLSFGATKLIDVGSGGLVLTNDRALRDALLGYRTEAQGIALEVRQATGRLFRESFYHARGFLSSDEAIGRQKLRGLIEIYRPLLYQTWDSGSAPAIVEGYAAIQPEIERRHRLCRFYAEELQGTGVEPVGMSDDSLPWRFTFKIPGLSWADQTKIGLGVREYGIDISHWYLPSHWLLTEGHGAALPNLSNTQALSREIFQFWMDPSVDRDVAKRGCAALGEVLAKGRTSGD